MAIQPVLVSRLRNLDTAWVAPPAQRQIELSPRVTRALSMGYWAAVVDWLWIRAMIDPAIYHVRPGEHPPAFYDMDLASRLDPGFFHVYADGSMFLTVIRDDNHGALSLLERGELFRKRELASYGKEFGLRFWASSWRLPMILGYVRMFEMEDLPGAAAAFTEAGRLPGAPEYIARLADRFSSPGGAFEVGIRLLNQMIAAEKDPRARQTLIEKRQSVFLGQYLHALDSQFLAFLSKDTGYRSADRIAPARMREYWEKFKRSNRIPSTDPFGGQISVDASGRVVTTTPRIKVFGLN